MKLLKSKLKTLSCVLAVVLCMTAFSVTAFAADGGYYASNENETETPPESIDSIVIGTEDVKLPEDSGTDNGNALTPDGNMSLIDDILQKNPYVSEEDELAEKQFITVQSKNGNYFYLVIDRSGDTENVYFLNLVDEADLMALMEDGTTETPVTTCTCTDKCVVGSINTNCEICRTNMSECTGKEAVVDTEPEPDADEPAVDEPADEPQSNSGLLIVVLIIAVGAGGAIYWFKFRNKQPKNKGSDDLDDYNFGQDDEDEEETEIDDADLMAEADETNEDEENN
jgi:hypothetical protein